MTRSRRRVVPLPGVLSAALFATGLVLVTGPGIDKAEAVQRATLSAATSAGATPAGIVTFEGSCLLVGTITFDPAIGSVPSLSAYRISWYGNGASRPPLITEGCIGSVNGGPTGSNEVTVVVDGSTNVLGCVPFVHHGAAGVLTFVNDPATPEDDQTLSFQVDLAGNAAAGPAGPYVPNVPPGTFAIGLHGSAGGRAIGRARLGRQTMNECATQALRGGYFIVSMETLGGPISG